MNLTQQDQKLDIVLRNQGVTDSNFEISDVSHDTEKTVIADPRAESLEEGLDSRPEGNLIYSINDRPPWYLCILLGFQHYILAFGGILAIPLILAEPLCIKENNAAKSQLISTIFFVSGMCTLLQTTLGTRLPILQGGTFTFITPTLAILALPKWRCPDTGATPHPNATDSAALLVDDDEVWKVRIREIQGAILMASMLQLVLGLSGLVGLVLRFIGPLAIAPTISLIGLSLFIQAGQKSGAHWGIAALTVCLILLFSQYLSKVNLPLIAYKDKKWKVFQYPLFKLFSALFGMCGAWLVCFLLTYFNALPSSPNEYGYMARTDINLNAVKSAAWFYVPYPDPVIGGMFLVMFGMVAAVGISNLQYVDLNSSRNLLILGFSTFSGLVLPTWFHSNPGTINTGIKELDQLIMILFTTHMFIGGFFGFVLDNTIPGTEKERGIKSWRKTVHEGSQIHVTDHSCYNLPFCTNFIQRFKLLHYLPFLPSVKSQELGTHL
ncbi:solute carrier family 23 member 2-like [Sinocyclocheilus grahami]|uniref:solute carrier family 23 member 2-like n=1 Tax=Sinocyclocheilus grahami TaxID=75366 RepID=UPI0007ACF8AA|nr:PREDICTED: solute carrier family 23 member 2-like [Sinocyclocheilus grahami]